MNGAYLHRAFTLIELLVVIAIVGILSGLTILGLGSTIDSARVQRSAVTLVQSFSVGQAAAVATGRAHTMVFNSARSDWLPTNLYYGNGPNIWSPKNWFVRHTWGIPAANWSERPEDQWWAIMGPWQDADGRWWQARGGPPQRDGVTKRPIGGRGGCFGPKLNAAGELVGAVDGNGILKPPANWNTAWTWDPYGVQIGPRQFLERGVRWLTWNDAPEWSMHQGGDPRTANGEFKGNDTIAFATPLSAALHAGADGGMNAINLYPSGSLDRNQCATVTTFTRTGQGANTLMQANFYNCTWIGICSTRTRDATFKTGTATPEMLRYKRPVAMLWLSLLQTGVITLDRGPRFML